MGHESQNVTKQFCHTHTGCMHTVSQKNDPTTWVVSANAQFATIAEKTISGVHVSPGSAETLVRMGGITNHHSIAYSLSNISTKSYQNRLMCVEVIACNISVVFRRSVYDVCWYRGGGERGEASGGGRAAQSRDGGRGEGDRRRHGRARPSREGRQRGPRAGAPGSIRSAQQSGGLHGG